MRGALVYHESLRERLRWAENEEPSSHHEKVGEVKLESMVELIVAAQTYGSKPKSGARIRNRQDLDYLLSERWKAFPISIVSAPRCVVSLYLSGNMSPPLGFQLLPQ